MGKIIKIIVVILLFGLLFGGSDTSNNVNNSTTQGSSNPSIKESITVYQNGQQLTIECRRLVVTGDGNSIIIANHNIESILVVGSGNSIAYSHDAHPRIGDYGDYNSIWSTRWI